MRRKKQMKLLRRKIRSPFFHPGLNLSDTLGRIGRHRTENNFPLTKAWQVLLDYGSTAYLLI